MLFILLLFYVPCFCYWRVPFPSSQSSSSRRYNSTAFSWVFIQSTLLILHKLSLSCCFLSLRALLPLSCCCAVHSLHFKALVLTRSFSDLSDHGATIDTTPFLLEGSCMFPLQHFFPFKARRGDLWEGFWPSCFSFSLIAGLMHTPRITTLDYIKRNFQMLQQYVLASFLGTFMHSRFIFLLNCGLHPYEIIILYLMHIYEWEVNCFNSWFISWVCNEGRIVMPDYGPNPIQLFSSGIDSRTAALW